jgi:hypothetical protein
MDHGSLKNAEKKSMFHDETREQVVENRAGLCRSGGFAIQPGRHGPALIINPRSLIPY